MAFLDFLSGKIKCPNCGRDGAKKSGDGYQCPNPHCKWFDAELAPGDSARQVMTPTGPAAAIPPVGSVSITYRNFKGEIKTFNVDPGSSVRKKNHWVVKTSTGGPRTGDVRDPMTGEPKRLKSSEGPGIVLSRDRIENLEEFEAAMPQKVAPGQEWPTPRERQVMGYHQKYKTTSPLYEQIRAKYPNW